MNETIPDPIKAAARLISPESADELERRLKNDIFASITRIKPSTTHNIDFESHVMDGQFFEQLSAPLQGIAIARTEGALAFYNRVGWHVKFLDAKLSVCVPEAGLETLANRYHARTLHDLCYVHPKHFEKMLGKLEAAALWEALKRFSASGG